MAKTKQKQYAITVFVDNNPDQLQEFIWLYKSWIYTGAYLCYDLVVFVHPDAEKNLPKDNNLRVVPFVPLSDRDPAWASYKYINSVHYLSCEEAEFVKGYDAALRTDNDVFLTKHFCSLGTPRLARFGLSVHVQSDFVANRLVEMTKKMGLNHHYFHNVGSTIYASGEQVVQFSKLQHSVCLWLWQNAYDVEQPWPGWYRGVLTMYAGEIAANGIFGNGIMLGGLDSMSMSCDKMASTDYHIHAYHTSQFFSKHLWRKGEYKDRKISELDREKINEYCLFLVETPVEEIIKGTSYVVS